MDRWLPICLPCPENSNLEKGSCLDRCKKAKKTWELGDSELIRSLSSALGVVDWP